MYIYEKCGPLTSLIPLPGFALPLQSGQAMRTPTPNMIYSVTPFTKNDATAQNHTRSGVTVAFFWL